MKFIKFLLLAVGAFMVLLAVYLLAALIFFNRPLLSIEQSLRERSKDPGMGGHGEEG